MHLSRQLLGFIDFGQLFPGAKLALQRGDFTTLLHHFREHREHTHDSAGSKKNQQRNDKVGLPFISEEIFQRDRLIVF